MIPCPYCEREFEKRAGVMRHVTVAHPAEGAVPTNVGGAIEPVVPVEAETYAEGLTAEQLVPGQEPYIDPPVSEAGVEKVMEVWEQARSSADVFTGVVYGGGTITQLPAQPAPTTDEYKRIRQLRREGLQEREAWMTVVGYEPPVSEPAEPDGRPVRLQQVAFRVRNGWADQMDARWLLRLADLGAEAVALLDACINDVVPEDTLSPVIARWQEALR